MLRSAESWDNVNFDALILQEASAMAKLLAAEEALSTSLWWSLPQKQKIKGRYAVRCLRLIVEVKTW